MVTRYPDGDQGVLHAARPAATRTVVLGLDCSRPRATARSSAARSASTTTTCSAAHRRAQPAARGVRVVPRPAQVRHVPARRLRDGPRARGRVDLRPPRTCARRFRTRGCSTGSTLSLEAMTAKTLPTVGVVSLGCPKNLVDTEVMLGHLQKAGHAIVPDGRGARRPRQHLRLHRPGARKSRSRRSSSRSSARSAARSTASSSRAAWCRSTARELARRSRKSTPSSASTSSRTPPRPRSACRRCRVSRTSRSRRALYDELAPRVLSRHRGYAYLKVGEGCDNPCTFCTIPQMRGLQRSRTIESLVAEAHSLEAQGVTELVLISQDTTRYGEDLGAGRDGPGEAGRGAAGRDVVSRGSAFSTPIRRRSTTRSSSSWPASRASCPTSTFRSSTSRARSCPRCAAAATRSVPRA